MATEFKVGDRAQIKKAAVTGKNSIIKRYTSGGGPGWNLTMVAKLGSMGRITMINASQTMAKVGSYWWLVEDLQVPKPEENTHPEEVGVASSMPGTSAFTMVVFKAADVPTGTPVYVYSKE